MQIYKFTKSHTIYIGNIKTTFCTPHLPSSIFHLPSSIFICSYFPLFISSLFARAVFSKLPQELPLVALCQQEKISPIFTRLSITIGARVAVVSSELTTHNLQLTTHNKKNFHLQPSMNQPLKKYF